MFQGGWQILIFCFRLKWKAEDFSIDTCKCPGPIFCMNNSTVAGEPLRASTLFSTIAGKSQNLSDERSEACADDWFSIIRGILSFAMTSRKTHVDEMERLLVNFRGASRL